MNRWSDDGWSPEMFHIAIGCLGAAILVIVLAVFGVVDMDDTEQRQPILQPNQYVIEGTP